MATPKRKRKTTRTKPNKQPKYDEHNDAEPSSSGSFWEAERILDERVKGKKLQYLLEWKGFDPATGEPYEPSWEPKTKDSPTQDLVREWEAKKVEQARASASRSVEGSKAGTRPAKQLQQDRPPTARRPSRVIESSPEPEPSAANSTAASATPQTTTAARDDTAPAIQPSSAVTSPIRPPQSPSKRPSPAIQIEPRSSFNPDDYERFTQLPPTQHPSSQPNTETSDLNSSQLFAAAPVYLSSGIVPDTQSSIGEGSFVPGTQHTTGTTQYSSTAEESQEEVTEDSGLLEIVQQAPSRAHSPARSIPETIYDTGIESQTQRQEREEDPQESSLGAAEESLGLTGQDVLPDHSEIDTTSLGIVQEHRTQPDKTVAPPVQVAPPNLPAHAPQEPIEVSSSHEDTSSSAFISTGTEKAQDHQEDDLNHSAQHCVQQYHQQDGDVSPSRATSALQNSEVPAPQPSNASVSQVIDSQDGEAHEQELTDRSESTIGSEALLLEEGESLATPADHRPAAAESVKSLVEKNHTQEECVESSHSQSGNGTQQGECQDLSEASLAGRSEPDDTARPSIPFVHPHRVSPESTQVQGRASEALHETELDLIPAAQKDAGGASEQVDSEPIDTSTSEAAKATSDTPLAAVQAVEEDLVSQHQPEVSFSHNKHPAPDSTQISAQTQDIAQPPHVPLSTTETPQHQDIAVDTNFSLEQNAQVVHTNNDISTQDDTTETIWPTIEKAYVTAQSSPSSRHDSSQDTPEPPARPVTQSSSPIVPPPNESLGTLVSNVPSRPRTPAPTSSLTIMATPPNIGDLWKQKESERKVAREKKRAEKNAALRESLRAGDASMALGASGPLADGRVAQSNLLQTAISPSAPLTEGTRSPSTVPDRVPAAQAPTSLRTIALTQAGKGPLGQAHEEERHASSTKAPLESMADAPPPVPAIVTTEATMADASSSDDDEANETSDQSQSTNRSDASLLDDELDLNLAVHEKMVPLSLEVRQRDQYFEILKKDKVMLDKFANEPHSFESLTNIEDVLSKLRNLENHFDLIYEEASLPSQDGIDDTRQSNALSWGIENSVKFGFLWGMFEPMRSQNKHVLLVTQNDSDALYQKIEQFCRAGSLNFKIPTRGRQASPTQTKSDLLVTIFPSTSSPIIKPADLIICLDGVQDANQLRQKNWAVNPSLEFVPVLHLVIPRSVSHIERCLSASISHRKRLHTIVACLAHMMRQLGDPINGDIVEAKEAAAQVAAWLEDKDTDGEEWPLEPLGSVTEVVQFYTQRSQGSPTGSGTPPAAERSKRPHEDEVLDPAKRMRLTPQPQDGISSSVNENEVTRISDSMPGTAADTASTLRSQLAYVESILKKERIERQSEQAHFCETEIMWTKQQTVYEDLSRDHRLQQSKLKELNEKVDTLTKSNESCRERLANRTEEARTAAAQLQQERETHLLSNDEKTSEIAKLRTELAQAIQDKERAVKSAASANSTLEYTKDQYRTAQDAATSSATTVVTLEAQNRILTHAASGERQKLKAMHLDQQHKTQVTANKALRAENNILKKALSNKEDEVARAKLNGGRMGVGTRATSVTPQPNRVRSRAGSPAMGGGRLSNLRNG